MEELILTKKQMCRFLLRKQGLLGGYQFDGSQGVMDFISQAGCIQFDPVDVCGKSPELVLNSRVRNFSRSMLYDLLYEKRQLIDYFDKNLAIFPVWDWPYFEGYRTGRRDWERSHLGTEVLDQIKQIIREKGPVCSADLDLPDKVDWYWSETKLSRAALEHLYFAGELAIHHKNGTIKYYDLIERCLPREVLAFENPFPDEYRHYKWRVLRRIGSVGCLWNRASDAWLNIDGLKQADRNQIFAELLDEGKIIEMQVEDVKWPLYIQTEDMELLEECCQTPAWKKRCEFLAPLDNLLWDRKLIYELFGFDYKWEIYTPVVKRKYGHYVLPVLYGENFAGRIEASADRKKGILEVRNIWYEDGIRQTSALQKGIGEAVKRLAGFNECETIVYLPGAAIR